MWKQTYKSLLLTLYKNICNASTTHLIKLFLFSTILLRAAEKRVTVMKGHDSSHTLQEMFHRLQSSSCEGSRLPPVAYSSCLAHNFNRYIRTVQIIMKFGLPSTSMFLLWVSYTTGVKKYRPATLSELNSLLPVENLTDDISRSPCGSN